MNYRYLLKSSGFVVAAGIAISCIAVGCSKSGASDDATSNTNSDTGGHVTVKATPPPNFDSKSAQAQLDAGQKASEELRKKIEASKK